MTWRPEARSSHSKNIRARFRDCTQAAENVKMSWRQVRNR
jgi:hypothetical protein